MVMLNAILAESDVEAKVGKLFSPERFQSAVEEVLNLMIKRAGDGNETVAEMTLIEALSIAKEVLIDRLEPYKADASYKERRGDGRKKASDVDSKATIRAVGAQIDETLKSHFPKFKVQMGQLNTLVISKILAEIERVGIASAVANIDFSRTDSKSKDVFGYMMRFIERSDIRANPEDALVAKKTLVAKNKEARNAPAPTRRRSTDDVQVGEPE